MSNTKQLPLVATPIVEAPLRDRHAASSGDDRRLSLPWLVATPIGDAGRAVCLANRG